MRPVRIAARTREVAALALAAIALTALALTTLALTACTSGAVTSEPSAAPAPTHAIVYVAEHWVTPSPAGSEEDLTQVGVNWRVSAIDLASGEERILAADLLAIIEPRQLPALSPDGSQLLYGKPEFPADAIPSRYFNPAGSMRLYRLDLATGEALEACPQLVRSFGWDGDDVIATTWRDAIIAKDGASTSYSTPPPDAVLRVSGSEISTIVPEVAVRSEDPDVGALTDQLDYLGSDGGDLYFEEHSDMIRTPGRGDPTPRRIWRLHSGETSLTPAITLWTPGDSRIRPCRIRSKAWCRASTTQRASGWACSRHWWST